MNLNNHRRNFQFNRESNKESWGTLHLLRSMRTLALTGSGACVSQFIFFAGKEAFLLASSPLESLRGCMNSMMNSIKSENMSSIVPSTPEVDLVLNQRTIKINPSDIFNNNNGNNDTSNRYCHRHHHHHRKHCTLRSLNLISLCFGLAAAGSLSLAASTDFWLYTNEPVRTTNDSIDYSFHLHHHFKRQPSAGDKLKTSYYKADMDDDDDDDDDEYNGSDVTEVTTIENEVMIMQIKIHSGLWRACIIHDDPGELNFVIG